MYYTSIIIHYSNISILKLILLHIPNIYASIYKSHSVDLIQRILNMRLCGSDTQNLI